MGVIYNHIQVAPVKMERAFNYVQDNLRLAEEKIASLEKERAAKDLRLLDNITELQSLQARIEKMIRKAT